MVRESLGESVVGIVFTGVAASLALTPTLAALGNRLARKLRERSASVTVTAELLPQATTAPVVVFGMDEVGRSVAEALEAHAVAYDALDGDYDRFLAAGADGYPVAFGNPGDVRLMETLAYGERKAVVITVIRYGMAASLAPTLHERYPDLPCFTAVETEEEKKQFEQLGLRPVVDRSIPRGLDLAAAVLRHQGIEEAKIEAWMRLRQERALHSDLDGEGETDFDRLRTSRI
jgi:CPA2 family monovalent cation:H+ antiporter-2